MRPRHGTAGVDGGMGSSVADAAAAEDADGDGGRRGVRCCCACDLWAAAVTVRRTRGEGCGAWVAFVFSRRRARSPGSSASLGTCVHGRGVHVVFSSGERCVQRLALGQCPLSYHVSRIVTYDPLAGGCVWKRQRASAVVGVSPAVGR